jgi:hypothetical protein
MLGPLRRLLIIVATSIVLGVIGGLIIRTLGHSSLVRGGTIGAVVGTIITMLPRRPRVRAAVQE